MKKTRKMLNLIGALLCCLMLTAGVVYADTDGTELQVAQPMTLELQLGPQWAGVEFQLKTDAGLYPGVVVVGTDGVLRTELGGSTNYVLSCLDSTVAAPTPGDIEPQAPATTYPAGPVSEPTAEGTPVPEETKAPGNPNTDAQEPAEDLPSKETTVGGIPVKHIILFGGGMLIAIGSLVAIRIVRKRRATGTSQYDETDSDDEY